MKQLTFWASVLMLGAACTAGDVSAVRNAISTCYEGEDPACFEEIESGEADDVYDACFEEHARCLEGSSEGTSEPGGHPCDAMLEACFDVYDETDEVGDAIGFCYDEAEDCTRSLGLSSDECIEVLEICLESIDEPADPDDAGDAAEACFEGHYECLEGMSDPVTCDLVLDECLHAACPPELPGPEDPCIEIVEACVEDAPDPEAAEMCAHVVEGCYPDPELPPCEADFFVCLEAGDDPAFCEELLWTCEPPEPDPADPGDPMPINPCEEEFYHCVSEGWSEDPAFCEEQLRTCELDVETPDPCAEEWIAFDNCIFEGNPPEVCEGIVLACEVPPVDCWAEFDECLVAGEDPAICEEIRCICEDD